MGDKKKQCTSKSVTALTFGDGEKQQTSKIPTLITKLQLHDIKAALAQKQVPQGDDSRPSQSSNLHNILQFT